MTRSSCETTALLLYHCTATSDMACAADRWFMRYYGLYPGPQLTLSAVKEKFHPYKNGYVTEVTVDDSGSGDPAIWARKHYSMGRYVAPAGLPQI
eukprot:1190094-Prorocentrum_minimum.AAC.3